MSPKNKKKIIKATKKREKGREEVRVVEMG
jgi:hypothetical protein